MAELTPGEWWKNFCIEQASLKSQPLVIFQKLVRATEIFRPDDHRRDPALVKIWLAYLEAHYDIYGDGEEIRKLFRFLRSEHVGANNAELHLRHAHFELLTGKPEKCLAILESAVKIPTLAQNEALRKAQVELKLLGTFRMEPLIEGELNKFAPPITPLGTIKSLEESLKSSHSVITNGILATPSTRADGTFTRPFETFPTYEGNDLNVPNERLITATPSMPAQLDFVSLTRPMKVLPLPTPVSQPTPSTHLTPLPVLMEIEAGRRESIDSSSSASVPRVSPDDGPSLSGAITRLRRLGNLGPPKRTVVPNTQSPSPDSAVPWNHGGTSSGVSSGGVANPSNKMTTDGGRLHDGEGRVNTINYQEGSSDINSPSKVRSPFKMTISNSFAKDTIMKFPIQNADQVTTSSIPPPLPLMNDIDQSHSPSKTFHMELTNNNNYKDRDKDKDDMSMTNAANPASITMQTVKSVGIGEDTTTITPRSRVVKVNGKSYKVLQLIGRGGSSKVFKVLAPDGTILALKKVNLRNQDETTLNGYLNEISLLRTLSSAPHIIRLVDYEVNREHGNLYIVMEYGEADLGRLLREQSKLLEGSEDRDFNFIRYMWQQMLRAVQTVHAAKIVHCDLKPANFLLVGGRLKLIDFGISKAIMNDTTNIVRENQVGTVNYMSPEALQESSASERGRIKIGRASDVWSLGCILYEMVYGRPPFARFTLIQRLHKILDPSYDIEYGQLSEPALLKVLQGCLQRVAKKRLTLDELLIHPFLIPHSVPPLIPNDSVIVSQSQLVDLMEKFARHIPQMDALGLAQKVFVQWQREREKSQA